MSGGLKAESVSKQSTLFGIIVILFSLVPLSLYTDTVEASTSGEMGIVSSTPTDNSVIASFESITFWRYGRKLCFTDFTTKKHRLERLYRRKGC